jgi:hypothetical protein
MLFAVVGDEPFERPCLLGHREARLLPRLQEPLLPRDREPSQAGLEVDGQPLESVRRREDLLSVSVQVGRRAELVDRQEQHGERATHEQSEQARRDERSRSKAAASVSRRRPHGSRG